MSEKLPWYKRVCRWGQTNLTEIDPSRYDMDWWRKYWRETRIQGVIVNAGGIVYYYPTKYSIAHRAEYLGGRDFFGEIVNAAREEGLAVLARMDSSSVDEKFFLEHPDWIARGRDGKPYRAGSLYLTCINSPYYSEFLPAVFEEIIERYHPDGFTDNGWSGPDRNYICYCPNCARKFKDAAGMELPKGKDWDVPAYQKWIEWSYGLRLEVWDLNNKVTRKAGGNDCLWVGMNSGDLLAQSQRFRDYKAICERAEIIMLDHQHRQNATGFQSNGEAGKLVHGLLGWDKLIPESTPLYQGGDAVFRVSSKPEPEVKLWALEGFAGGVQPWWHHIGAYHEDRRQYKIAAPIFAWHEKNEKYLINRSPVATVGMLWTQRNIDFYGRDAAEVLTQLPWRGFANAMLRTRIPYLPIHVDNIEKSGNDLKVLILPNLGALSDRQCNSIREFVEQGGGLVATGESSLYDEWGKKRSDFALSDVFSATHTGKRLGLVEGGRGLSRWDHSQHSYLRLHPELRAGVDGPMTGNEPRITVNRHPVLKGFEETDIIPFGGALEVVKAVGNAQTPLTLVPPFPVYPPEFSYMKEPSTPIPGLVVNEVKGKGRVAYLPADIDRCFARDMLPDFANLLANVVRWATNDNIPLEVAGAGFIDCHLYRQENTFILHLVNLTNSGTWRAPLYEYISVGPLTVRLQMPEGLKAKGVRLLVKERELSYNQTGRWVSFEINSITDHEVVIIETR
jgi:hypothetical protein